MLRSAARDLLPPAFLRFAGRVSGRSLAFTAAPGGWSEAASRSSGYDAGVIVDKVARATREVVAGRAAFERDSVLFARQALPFQLLAPLLRAALRHERRLEVIDFGGSLGSVYRQCRPFMPLEHVQWRVIEQASFVAAGLAEFSTPELSFHQSLAELGPADVPRVLLASSVLQYLEEPDSIVQAWTRIDADTIILDRTPMAEAADHRLCIQHVPRQIYKASYPCWILSRSRLLAPFEKDWRLVAEFDCPEGVHRLPGAGHLAFKGLILERKS